MLLFRCCLLPGRAHRGSEERAQTLVRERECKAASEERANKFKFTRRSIITHRDSSLATTAQTRSAVGSDARSNSSRAVSLLFFFYGLPLVRIMGIGLAPHSGGEQSRDQIRAAIALGERWKSGRNCETRAAANLFISRQLTHTSLRAHFHLRTAIGGHYFGSQLNCSLPSFFISIAHSRGPTYRRVGECAVEAESQARA